MDLGEELSEKGKDRKEGWGICGIPGTASVKEAFDAWETLGQPSTGSRV